MGLKRQFSTMLIAGAAAAFSAASPAIADDVTIQDTSGFTRAASQVEGTGKVEFSVVSEGGAAAEGVPVTLTNAATGQVMTATASNGVVVFEGVSPGVWTVSTSAPGITFTNVTILSATGAGLGITGGSLIPALAIGGAGAGATIAISNRDNDNDEMSPSS